MANEQVYVPTDANDASARMTVGTEWDNAGKSYRYVLVEDANLAANDVVEFSDATGAEVTNDRAGGASLGRSVAGVALGTVTDGQYGVIQTRGLATVKVPANTAVAAGNYLVPHATSDGAVAVATTSTLGQIFAVALAADTATTSAAGTVAARLIRC